VRFKKARHGAVTADLSDVESAVLTSAVGQLLHLLGEQVAVDDDPLAALVGLPSGEVRRPEDPALARLLPDAYRPDASDADGFDAAEAAADFRRYTEGDLRAGKRAHAAAVLESLAGVPGGGRLRLERPAADAWLGTLNDLRLVLGTRLDVTEDSSAQPPPQDDELAHALEVYSWLGWLQESLLEVLPPRAAGADR
jgi:hypothetical protein